MNTQAVSKDAVCGEPLDHGQLSQCTESKLNFLTCLRILGDSSTANTHTLPKAKGLVRSDIYYTRAAQKLNETY